MRGKANPPLTDVGDLQASIAAKRLPEFTLLASSDLERAKVTAEIFAESHGRRPEQIVVEPLVQERRRRIQWVNSKK